MIPLIPHPEEVPDPLGAPEPPPFAVDPLRDTPPGHPTTPRHLCLAPTTPLAPPADGADGEGVLIGDDPESDGATPSELAAKARLEALGGGLQLLFGMATALFALALVILAATVRTWDYAVAASICAPPAFVYLTIRWRAWLGRLPYCYRLLTSLGEDAGNLMEDHLRRVETRRHRKALAREAKEGRRRARARA